jgi:beta-lactamase class A
MSGTSVGSGYADPDMNGTAASQREILRTKLERTLRRIVDSFDGVLGVQFLDLSDGTRVGINEQMLFPQASSIKIPILIELFRQAESRPALLRERQRVTGATLVGGSGILRHFVEGSSELSNEDLAVLMIGLSDNTATDLLIDVVGMQSVNQTMVELGAPQTQLRRKMIDPQASARGEENLSTPREAADLMARIARCELPVSARGCEQIRRILAIPGSVVRRVVPSEIPVASKPGGIAGVSVIWAIVEVPDRPFVFTAMTNYGLDDGRDAIERAAKAAYDHAARLGRATDYGTRVPLEILEAERG